MPVLTRTEIKEIDFLVDVLRRYGSRMDMEKQSAEQIRLVLAGGAHMSDEQLREKVAKDRAAYKAVLQAADTSLLWTAAQTLNKQYLLDAVRGV